MAPLSFARRAAVAIVRALLGCFLLEVFARVVGLGPPPPERTGYVSDPVLPCRLRAHAAGVRELAADGARIPFRHNGRGFQDRERMPGKVPGSWRIVALGDSFTYGTGAPPQDGWPAQLERLLAERPGCHVPVEVVNSVFRATSPPPSGRYCGRKACATHPTSWSSPSHRTT